MRVSFLFAFFFIFGFYVNGQEANTKLLEALEWSVYSEMPPLPGKEIQPGVAGSFDGIHNNNLIIAGGANFPVSLPWDGGVKRYWSDVYTLSLDETSEWNVHTEVLPKKLAYGVSVTLQDGVLIIGGSNSDEVSKDVYLLTYHETNNEILLEDWPDLPVPLTNMTGTKVDDKIYVAGGQDSINNPSATNHFFVLDVKNIEIGWESLESWPGPPRSFAVSASQSDGFDNCLYLFSGRNYGPDRSTEILNDGYKYNPRLDSWEKLVTPKGPQFPVMAGAAFSTGENHIVFIGGDDGALMKKQIALQENLDKLLSISNQSIVADSIDILKNQIYDHWSNHPGFSNDILFYHTITNTITKNGEVPFQVPVTTNVIKKGDKIFIPSGEVRPGVRTPNIISGEFITSKRNFGFANYVVVFLYFGILVWIGWFFSKRQKTTNDYFRGGKRVPWWLAGLSIFGTALSAITFMAIPAKTFATDWSYILLNVGIIAVAPVIIFLCIPFYRKLDVTTAYEYLEQRFNIAARLIASASFILFQIGRMGVVLFLPSLALNVVTGIDIFVCITFIGVISLAYTMAGGIEAVIWTDALQVIVLLGGAIFALIVISMSIDGGMIEIFRQGTAEGKFHLGDVSTDLKNPTLLTMVLTAIFSPLITYGTDQTMVQRYISTSTEKEAGKSVWTNAALTIPASLIFFFLGTALFVFYKENAQLLSATVTGGDSIFPWFIINQMPPGVSGLLIAGLFAAAMSTLSSSMNSAATAYSVDIHFRFGWANKFGDLKLARIATLILGIAGISVAIFMASWDIKSLWDEFQKILGLILGSIGGLFFLGFMTKRANTKGAMIGLISSVLVQIWLSQTGLVHLLLYTATGFASCFVIGYLASLLMPGNKKNISHLTIYSLNRLKR
ncbi:MAG: sodium/solute symporter [Candidatus Paceibacterota bacterium]